MRALMNARRNLVVLCMGLAVLGCGRGSETVDSVPDGVLDGAAGESVVAGPEVAREPRLPVLAWEQRSDWISVKDHGTVGDGEADDTAAIQSAFDLLDRGVTIYFPPGIYRVTQTLRIEARDERPLVGVGGVIGHGRDSRLVWDGVEGEPLIWQEGMAYTRWVGLDLDGSGKASIGQYHFSKHTFETAHRKQHMAYRNFTEAGVLAAPDDAFAIAETSFENCLFINCDIGVSYTQFNDYNITFDGCEFRDCGQGILSRHGNFYVRNTHFQGSRRVDIESASEHGCSVRRSTSLGSRRFIYHRNPVSTLIVEGCHVAEWEDPAGAVVVAGAPVVLVDNRFSDPPAEAAHAVRIGSPHQRLIHSNNRVPEGLPLFNADSEARRSVQIHEVPAGAVAPVALAAGQRFFREEVAVPGKVFDAVRDFGASGDLRQDDTDAIQAAIDAARVYGNGAIAYIPAGRYAVSRTLRVEGRDYTVGGAGLVATYLDWRGGADGITMLVENADRVTIEHLNVERGNNAAGLLVLDGGRPVHLVLDGVFGARRGKPDDPPFPPAVWLRGLGAGTVVDIRMMLGNLHIEDSAAATILTSLSYDGGLVVEDRTQPAERGFLGFLTRFSGGRWNVMVRNNQSLVMSDYYSENSGVILRLEGNGEAPGQVVVGGPKIALSMQGRADDWKQYVLDTDGYAGRVSYLSGKFHGRRGAPMRLVAREGEPLVVTVAGASFYHADLLLETTGPAEVALLGSVRLGQIDVPLDEVVPLTIEDTVSEAGLQDLAYDFDAFRQLGRLDLRINHPHVLELAHE